MAKLIFEKYKDFDDFCRKVSPMVAYTSDVLFECMVIVVANIFIAKDHEKFATRYWKEFGEVASQTVSYPLGFLDSFMENESNIMYERMEGIDGEDNGLPYLLLLDCINDGRKFEAYLRLVSNVKHRKIKVVRNLDRIKVLMTENADKCFELSLALLNEVSKNSSSEKEAYNMRSQFAWEVIMASNYHDYFCCYCLNAMISAQSEFQKSLGIADAVSVKMKEDVEVTDLIEFVVAEAARKAYQTWIVPQGTGYN